MGVGVGVGEGVGEGEGGREGVRGSGREFTTAAIDNSSVSSSLLRTCSKAV